MSKSADELSHIESARLYYDMLRAGRKDALELIPLIRKYLAAAGADVGSLDPEGKHTADELERDLVRRYSIASDKAKRAKADPSGGPGR